MSNLRKFVEVVVFVVVLAVVVVITVFLYRAGGHMRFWKIADTIALAGLLGGVVNALLSDSGFFLPGMYDVEGMRILKPGALGNAFLGAVAAFISWGLYVPFTKYVIIPPESDTALNLDVATLVGALVAGSAGSRLITSAIDKKVLTETAATAAGKNANPINAAGIATAPTPTQALAIARQMSPPGPTVP